MKRPPCGGSGLDMCGYALECEETQVSVAPVEEEESGMRKQKRLQDPRLPTAAEVEGHEFTHIPYHNWCAFCVTGKGKAACHRKRERKDGMPEIHMDYSFLSTEGSPLATVLVAKEMQTKMMLSTVVPMKGGSVEWLIRRALAFLREVGLETADIVLTSDQEHAIVDVINHIASRRKAASKVETLEEEEEEEE